MYEEGGREERRRVKGAGNVGNVMQQHLGGEKREIIRFCPYLTLIYLRTRRRSEFS